MKRIEPNNKIFLSENFQKDKYKFHLILKNLPSPELELYSDEENYIICRGGKEWPTWIWTKDNMDKNKIEDIEKLIKIYLTDNDKDKFTCKKEVYDLLVERKFENLNLDDYFEMGFLLCNKPTKPRECDGKITLATEEDKEILTKYWYEDSREMRGVAAVTIEQAEKDIKELLETGKFYILKSKEGKIVCMASYSVTENQAKVSHVYTPKEERRKGYAANLIYEVTKILLSKGHVPVLYTDYNYIASNKAYKNAGYEDQGILINFTCSKKD